MESGDIKRPQMMMLQNLSKALDIDVQELRRFLVRPTIGSHKSFGLGGAGSLLTVYQKEGNWWIGYVEELPGANAQGGEPSKRPARALGRPSRSS
ncbi:MAG: hypothetical protein JOZ19_05780 [Rubrobacter sp.]|nr:hypothetical protein [Rubrobacter sp.]